jgi:hypothetical protein
MLSFKKINDEKVSAILLPIIDKAKIKGSELFLKLYANIFLLTKKKSGKTSTIFKILQKCSNKNTKLIIFSSIVHKNPNWISIVKYFEKKNFHIEIFTSIFDENSGENLI